MKTIKTIKECKCDICKANIKNEIDCITGQYQVIFETEQTEGRPCKPYITNYKLDVCSTCYDKIINGNALYGGGAMGYNDYYFKNSMSNDTTVEKDILINTFQYGNKHITIYKGDNTIDIEEKENGVTNRFTYSKQIHVTYDTTLTHGRDTIGLYVYTYLLDLFRDEATLEVNKILADKQEEEDDDDNTYHDEFEAVIYRKLDSISRYMDEDLLVRLHNILGTEFELEE